MDLEDSWHTLTPGIVQQDRPAVFVPRDVFPVAIHSFPASQDAGMYTRSEPSNFWDSILISAASRNALKKFSQKLCLFKQQQEPGEYSLLCSSNRFLCRQHDLTWLLQRSVHGCIWTSCICS